MVLSYVCNVGVKKKIYHFVKILLSKRIGENVAGRVRPRLKDPIVPEKKLKDPSWQ